MPAPSRSPSTLILAFLVLFGAALLASACSGSDSSGPITPAARPTSAVVVSDEVPTMQELRETGLTDQQAECFIATIDPDDTGRVASVELFTGALEACL